jgi:Flp pilus assembly protein TadD
VSLEDYMGKLRALSVRAPARAAATRTFALTVEAQDPELAAVLLEMKVLPSAEQHLRAATRYRQLEILDAAYDHYQLALHLDPQNAEAYGGLARIWRDWGFPHLGLGDASRSVYYAPLSAAAHNTLGTILAALGRGAEARAAYQRALELDRRAAYALSNLCYLSFLEADFPRAQTECRSALDLDPTLTAARNNLALVYAASSREDLARQEFLAAGDTAAGLYNIGIVHLAKKRYSSASKAFEAAHRQRPSWTEAWTRARSARLQAAATATEDPPQ